MEHFNFRYTRYYKVLIAIYRILGFTIYDFLKKNPEVCYVNEKTGQKFLRLLNRVFIARKMIRASSQKKLIFTLF